MSKYWSGVSLDLMTGVLISKGKFGHPHRENMIDRLGQSLE